MSATPRSTRFLGRAAFEFDELFSWSLVLGSVLTIVGTAFVPYFTRRSGKRSTYAVLMGVSNVAVLACYFLPPSAVGWIVGLVLAISATQGPISAILWAMYADCADYSEWKNKRRATGLVFSAAVTSQKFGWSLGGAIPGWMLSHFGYIADTVLSPKTLNGILLTVSIMPPSRISWRPV